MFIEYCGLLWALLKQFNIEEEFSIFYELLAVTIVWFTSNNIVNGRWIWAD
jgi:hypothetical protein